MKVVFPTFAVKDNGEKDGEIYRLRFKAFCGLVEKLVDTGSVFFYDTSVSESEFVQTLKEHGIKDAVVLSAILKSPHVGLKSQIHQLYSLAFPKWYNPALAAELGPYVLDGYTVFDETGLQECVKIMKKRCGKVRVKRGNGTAGEDQIVLEKEDTKIPDNVIQDIETGGVVVEKNISDKTTYSYTSFILPQGMFESVGLIVTTPVAEMGGQFLYNGTICVVYRKDENEVDGFYYEDPIHGKLELSKDTRRRIAEVGRKIADIYRRNLSDAILPRVNLDLMFDEDRFVLVDTSLRAGGNTWSEYKGALEIISDPSVKSSLQSIRILENHGELRKLYGKTEEIAATKDICMFHHNLI